MKNASAIVKFSLAVCMYKTNRAQGSLCHFGVRF